ncbi:MAG: prephenate dehydratase [Clostridiales bacterium]|jgi:prephenate dehydratase|nr:prephenate dehydratase [Clostridiales bacterium]
MKRIGYLGPLGTFTHEAAVKHAGEECWELVDYPDIPELIHGVDRGEIEQAVVPMENSLEGTVNITVDMIIHEADVRICGELILPVAHCLLARHGVDISDLKVILSHPQALAQCRMFLRSTLGGGIKTLPATSTAAAARDVAAGLKEWGAIASKHAAGVYGLNIIRENIQGNYQNSTRFVVLSKEQREPTGCDKTSIVFSVDDKPGSLYHALKIFADSRINLTKIESRPMRTNLGEYLFVVDLEGHIRDGIVERALNRLAEQSKYFSVLGSYPRFMHR